MKAFLKIDEPGFTISLERRSGGILVVVAIRVSRGSSAFMRHLATSHRALRDMDMGRNVTPPKRENVRRWFRVEEFKMVLPTIEREIRLNRFQMQQVNDFVGEAND